MSAWLLDHAHWDALAAAIVRHVDDVSLSHREVFDLLAVANSRSYRARYGRRVYRETLKHLEAAETYVLRAHGLNGDFDRAALVTAMGCFSYQSCEYDGWPESEASLLLNRLASALGVSGVPDGYDTVSGWPITDAVLDLWLAGDFSAASADLALYGRR
jgi:hypothetical protein